MICYKLAFVVLTHNWQTKKLEWGLLRAGPCKMQFSWAYLNCQVLDSLQEEFK